MNKIKHRFTKKAIIALVIIAIIILMLLHQCANHNNQSKNSVDICDEENADCVRPGSNGLYVDCLKDFENPICIIPDFTGKTEQDVLDWLSKISNNLVINFQVVLSDLDNGIIIKQSTEKNLTVKDLLENNLPFIISFANSVEIKTDCLKDFNNSICSIPNFKGKSKNDVEKWLDSISNDIPVRYEEVKSNSKKGEIIDQSIKEGTAVKTIIEENDKLQIKVSDGTEENPKKGDQPVEPEIPKDEKDRVVVKDSSLTWDTNTKINIFYNSVANEKIAPESSNTYKFTVNNNTEYDIKYKIKFNETNNYNINMKYKLRKNNSYIVDKYSSLNELNINEQLLSANKNDTFYLEWKWISSENDTKIGASLDSNYSLLITVEAEATNE